MSNEPDPPPRNGDATRQFGIRVGIVVAAIVILAIVFGLFTGMIVVPPEIVTQVWVGVGVVITGTFAFLITYLQARGNRISLAEIAKQASISRDHSDVNARETRDRVAGTEEKVSTLIARVEDGLGNKMADIVKDNAAQVAEALRIKTMEQTMVALGAKLDALLSVQTPSPTVPAADPAIAAKLDSIIAGQSDTAAAVVALQDSTVTANTSAVIENSAVTEENSNARRNEPEGPS